MSQLSQHMGRREALRSLGVALPALLAGRALAAQDPAGAQAPAPRAGQGEVGELFNPNVAGKSRAPTVAGDNDERYKDLEQKLQCTCGCTLDIYTCRTTDFTCTYSPELHREVVALRDDGKTAQEILDAFVAKYGEKALMAPKPESFNLLGYLLPGALIALAGGGLFLFISRRKAAVATAAPAASGSGAPAVAASADEMERLRRALADVED